MKTKANLLTTKLPIAVVQGLWARATGAGETANHHMMGGLRFMNRIPQLRSAAMLCCSVLLSVQATAALDLDLATTGGLR